jgi:tyrosinase
MEIRDMQKNDDLFNLYLLGLNRFQQVPQDQMLSYYQIAGWYPAAATANNLER